MRLDDLCPGISEFTLEGRHYYLDRIENGMCWATGDDGRTYVFHGYEQVNEPSPSLLQRLAAPLRAAIP